MKYAPQIGIASALLLIVFTFMPWAYYPDLQEYFNGFYSKENTYGKPGVTLVFLAVISIILFLIPKNGAKWANQVIGVFIFAYSVKTYILFASCYNTICPLVKPGLIGMAGFSILLLVCSLLAGSGMKVGT